MSKRSLDLLVPEGMRVQHREEGCLLGTRPALETRLWWNEGQRVWELGRLSAAHHRAGGACPRADLCLSWDSDRVSPAVAAEHI